MIHPVDDYESLLLLSRMVLAERILLGLVAVVVSILFTWAVWQVQWIRLLLRWRKVA